MIGLLLDIDGCLTLPDHDISVLDTALMDRILDLDIPVAMVTGRSDGWLRKQYRELERERYLDIPTYIEFGLAKIDGDDVSIQEEAMDFLQLRIEFIDLLAGLCADQDIYFQQDEWYDDFPDHGSLWVEDKHIQLSIAANTKVGTADVHRLCDQAWKEVDDRARLLYHHLGIDVIPRNWSKAKATSHFVNNLDESDYHWYIFGDNDSDKEMARGLTSCTFVSTRDGASTTVRRKLKQLNLIAEDL